MTQLVLIAHNLRSAHNVGSLLRTAEGLGVQQIYLTGYTPYPKQSDDERLPHLIAKADKQIDKTALGARDHLEIVHEAGVEPLIGRLKSDGFMVVALEQTKTSIDLKQFLAPPKLALIVGREVEGVEPEIIELCDAAIQIPMLGHKESFNVVQAAAMALYQLRL